MIKIRIMIRIMISVVSKYYKILNLNWFYKYLLHDRWCPLDAEVILKRAKTLVYKNHANLMDWSTWWLKQAGAEPYRLMLCRVRIRICSQCTGFFFNYWGTQFLWIRHFQTYILQFLKNVSNIKRWSTRNTPN